MTKPKSSDLPRLQRLEYYLAPSQDMKMESFSPTYSPTIPLLYRLECFACHKDFIQADTRQMMCNECNERTKEYQKSNEEE